MIESKVNGNSISQHLQEPYLCTNGDFFFSNSFFRAESGTSVSKIYS